MAKPTVNVFSTPYFATILDVLKNGGFLSGKTDGGHFSLGHGGAEIAFTGAFSHAGGAVTGGTISGFVVTSGGVVEATSSGYAIDIEDLVAAIDALKTMDESGPTWTLLSAHGLILNDRGPDSEIYGTGYRDIYHGNAANNGASTGGGNDDLFGGSGNDVLFAGSDNDKLYGGRGNDELDGSSGEDFLSGGRGRDLLDGGTNIDELIGGRGKDIFIFGGEILKGFADTVVDFAAGIDRIGLVATNFGLDGPGDLDPSAFRVGSRAKDASDRIIYNPKTGALLRDFDGKGGEGQVKFAVLDGKPDLSADDFLIV